MVFGGLTAMFYATHPSLSLGAFLHKVDVRTVFFATVFMIVVLVLAYLTNPSETSFRAYLTEQSFRQHLSRLDENSHEDSADGKGAGLHYSRRKPPTTAPSSGTDYGTQSPFHFVNRASISLRTPKHVFHSFGILTVAAVFPNGPQARGSAMPVDDLESTVNDSWFIGAFGKWFRGGAIQAWWHGPLATSKDAERLSSGILDVKALDSLEGCDALPLTSSASTSLHLPSTDPASKYKGTERSAQRAIANTTRSSTPPPLPKSASLPLHAPKHHPVTPSKAERSVSSRQSPAQTSGSGCAAIAEHLRLAAPPALTSSPSSASLFDQSPAIAEILRQIALSKTAVHDLRTQLTEFRGAAAQSNATIQRDLDAHRERKRVEDAARGELKTRMKALDDGKRAAEGSRRDAEKRLRAAKTQRDGATQRIGKLEKDIGELEARMKEDQAAAQAAKEEGKKAEKEAAQELEMKRKEIKVAEEVVAALGSRAKELEERIAQEEERLRVAREQAELKKQDRSFFPLHVVTTVENSDPSPWSPIGAYNQGPAQDPHLEIDAEYSSGIEVFLPPPLQLPASASDSLSVSPRPKHLSLGGISNFREHLHPAVTESNGDVFVRPQSYALFDDVKLSTPLSSAPTTHSTRFSPFSDSDVESSPVFGGQAISPRSTSLIPSSLITSLERGFSTDDLSRSFQSDSDDVMDPNWRTLRPPPAPVEQPAPGALTASPSSITHPSFDGVDKEDPFEIRPPPLAFRRRLTSDATQTQRAAAPPAHRTTSDPQAVPQLKALGEDAEEPDKAGAHRRWNSADPKEKERKGLNPEAKVFRFTKKSLPSLFPSPALEPLPLGMQLPAARASTLTLPGAPAPLAPDVDTLFSSISMRAFAPSPAEREALTRALGSSSNASLERLPTLSEVSMPSPPSIHAVAAQQTRQVTDAGGRPLTSAPGFTWLQSLPRMSSRKPTFSPWEDEEPCEKHDEKA